MLIPFDVILKTHNVHPTGVFHVGANTGQEAGSYYSNGVQKSIWIEAIPNVFEQLKHNISGCANALAFNECVSDTDGQIVEFKITDNNGESSSILELGRHKEFYPQVQVVETIKCVTKKLDTLIDENKIDVSEYDFLVIDLQGAELLALKGLKNNLHKINHAYLEVNNDEVYVGCARVEQLDEFLLPYGLKRVQTYWTGNSWGDAFWTRTD